MEVKKRAEKTVANNNTNSKKSVPDTINMLPNNKLQAFELRV